ASVRVVLAHATTIGAAVRARDAGDASCCTGEVRYGRRAMRRPRRFELVALVVPLALLAFACSGGDDDDAGSSAKTTTTSTTKTSGTKTKVAAAKTIGLAYDLAGR